jgi:hypothetical protein
LHKILYVIGSLKESFPEIGPQVRTQRFQKAVIGRRITAEPLHQLLAQLLLAVRESGVPGISSFHEASWLQRGQKIFPWRILL